MRVTRMMRCVLGLLSVVLGFASVAGPAPADLVKQERTTDSLVAGKRGDFIVLDRDIFALDPFDLHNTQVRETYLDGRRVYSRLD
jgi:imidazolonepropionase-like amidohydrolase